MQRVQVAHPPEDTAVPRVLTQVPFDAGIVVPFARLAELATHEQELLSGLRPLVAEQEAQVGEPLPIVAGHLAEQRTLPVDDLVVGERQHEVLRVRVHLPERELAVVVTPMDRLASQVLQRVVHPTHVPLEPEPEPTHVRRARHHRPGGRFLGEGLGARVLSVDVLVQPAEERDGLEVLSTTLHVRQPLACLPRIVEVQHRCDGIHPQSVGVVRAEPVIGAGEQEAPNLVPAVVEDQRVPVGVVSATRIRVLVQVRAVEVREAVLVGGEVGGHPVEDHAETLLVQMVDQEHQVLGAAEPARRREVPGGLVAPGAVERMFHHGQEFDVGEAEVEHVVGELDRDFAIAEPPAVRPSPPGAEVDLVDGHRPREPVPVGARREPIGIPPVVGEIPDDRARPGRRLRAERERIRLVHEEAGVAGADVELVDVARARPVDTPGPDAGRLDGLEEIRAGVPAIEVADHRDLLCVRSPHRERSSVGACVGAQFLRESAVRSLSEQVEVVRGQGPVDGGSGHVSPAPASRRTRWIRSSAAVTSGRCWSSSRVHG